MRWFRFSIVALCLAIPVAFGIYAENSSRFSKLKNSLQYDSISTSMLNFGVMGRIFKRMDYIKLTANDEARYLKTEGIEPDIEQITFQKKRQVNEFLYKATPLHTKKNGEQEKGDNDSDQARIGWPVFSITIDNKYLHDSTLGIVTHRDQKGKTWERKGNVAFIENGKQLFSSAIGLRIHGGKRRTVKPFNSYRIYFRDEYGKPGIPGRLIFNDGQGIVSTLVVHTTDWPDGQPFNNPLAYDIANRIGALAPKTRLVELIINGKSFGMAYLTPHLSRREYQHTMGHADFGFYKFRGEYSGKDEHMYHNIFWKAVTVQEKLSMDNTGLRIDLDNMVRQIFSWVFCGTTDFCQGVGVYDYKNPDAKLHWLTWDMDHSFYDYAAEVNKQLKRENWRQAGFELFYRKKNQLCGRPILFSRLMQESDQFRQWAINLMMGLLNHKLTPEFLLTRVNYYNTMLKNYGAPHPEYIDMLTQFMKNRTGFIRKDMVHHFKLGGTFAVTLKAPGSTTFSIDGYTHRGGYQGTYFSGYPCTIEVEKGNKELFQFWLVDGEVRKDEVLKLAVKKEVTVEAVFRLEED